MRFSLVALLLILGMVEARASLSVLVPDTTAVHGGTVAVPVRVDNTDGLGIASAEVFVAYDGDLLTATGVDTAGTLFTFNWSVDENLVQGNGTSMDTVKVVAATSLDTLAGAGKLFEIGFTVADLRHPAAALLVPVHVLFNDGVPAALTASASFAVTGISGAIDSPPGQPRPGESVLASVEDGDEDRDPGTAESLSVRVRNGGQAETLTVTETGASTGLFAGSMATELSADPVSGDGVIQVQPGEVISFCYDDWLDAEGATVERCATATVIAGRDGEVRATVVAQPGDTVRVRVIDADLDGVVSVSAVNARTSEAETILLSRFAVGSSAFYGRFFTSAQAGGSGDSTLQVSRGDTLIVTYADELTAAGGTANVQGHAEVVDPFGDVDGEGHTRAFDAARVLQHRLERLTTGEALLMGLDSLAANVDAAAPPGPIDAYVPETVGGVELATARFNGGRIAGRAAGVAPAASLPAAFALHGNAPNPFNPETGIRFDLPTAAAVRLEVFDALGQKVRVLVANGLPAGTHRITWDGRSASGAPAASGIYFCRLQARSAADRFAATRRMLLLK